MILPGAKPVRTIISNHTYLIFESLALMQNLLKVTIKSSETADRQGHENAVRSSCVTVHVLLYFIYVKTYFLLCRVTHITVLIHI